MPYGLIVLVPSVALVVWYVFVAEAPYWLKGAAAGLLVGSLFWRYWFLLQAAIGVVLSLYFVYLKARYE